MSAGMDGENVNQAGASSTRNNSQNLTTTESGIQHGIPLPCKEAIRAVFEECGNDPIPDIGFAKPDIDATLSTLIDDYIAEGKTDLAMRAARITTEPNDYRKILESYPGQGNRSAGIEGAIQQAVLGIGDVYHEAILGTGDEKLIRLCADAALNHENKSYYSRTGINALVTLKDTETLRQTAAKIAVQFFDKLVGEDSVFNSTLATQVTEAYSEAIKLGDDKARSELLAFADKLSSIEHSALRPLKSYDSVDENILIQAYKKSGTNRGILKAATAHLVVAEESKDKFLEHYKEAGKLFAELGDSNQVALITYKLAENRLLVDALQIHNQVFGAPDFSTVDSFMLAAKKHTVDEVKENVLVYLNSRIDVDKPFPAANTYWHHSVQNDEWDGYLAMVEHLAGASAKDKHGYGVDSIARPLYASEEYREKIENLRTELQKHLLLGTMLSGLSHELEYGYDRTRKYPYAAHAANRTFNQEYRPLGKELSNLEADPIFARASAVVNKIEKDYMAHEGSSFEFDEGADALRRQAIPEAHKLVKELYSELTTRILEEVNAL